MMCNMAQSWLGCSYKYRELRDWNKLLSFNLHCYSEMCNSSLEGIVDAESFVGSEEECAGWTIKQY